jgi:hypothetical protein
MSPSHAINDPIERIVADALTEVGIEFEYEPLSHQLDFDLSQFAVAIECKAFETERSTKQLARRDNIILIQGKEAALFFAKALKGELRGRP